MPLQQRGKQLISAPARQFFDRRFGAVDARVTTAIAEAREDIAAAARKLLEQFDERLARTTFDIASVSRAHLESMSYVAAELGRLESTLGGAVTGLSERLGEALPAPGRTAEADAYAVHALAPLPRGARVLAVGHVLERAPYYLASLGYEVTVIGSAPYPVAHRNLEAVLGEPADLDAEPFDALLAAEGADADPALVRDGGLVVLAGATEATVDGLEVVDRSERDDAFVLLTLRRKAS